MEKTKIKITNLELKYLEKRGACEVPIDWLFGESAKYDWQLQTLSIMGFVENGRLDEYVEYLKDVNDE